jgi:hypothetical protein
MPLELKKIKPVLLRSLGLDERWLQDRIAEDPSLLGLGELDVIRKEKRQTAGGRIDFLMDNSDDDIRYVVEIMLGALDESHIIRTIEYWDIERQRYPSLDHRAVIVAENITSRFFNVIRLLNRAVPVIALQMSAFELDGSVALQFVKVLDIYEEVEPADERPAEGSSRSEWEKKSSSESLGVMDRVIELITKAGLQPRVTYNKYHVAVGTSGYNFLWLRPRKEASYCPITFRNESSERDEVIARLREAGLDAAPRGPAEIRLRLTRKECEEHSRLLTEDLKSVEVGAQR